MSTTNILGLPLDLPCGSIVNFIFWLYRCQENNKHEKHTNTMVSKYDWKHMTNKHQKHDKYDKEKDQTHDKNQGHSKDDRQWQIVRKKNNITRTKQITRNDKVKHKHGKNMPTKSTRKLANQTATNWQQNDPIIISKCPLSPWKRFF